MLTIILECKDNEAEAAYTLAAFVAGAVEGLVSDVIILDNGSNDGISTLADAAGARFYAKWDLPEIIRSARGDWLLFVEPGARPQPGWIEELHEYLSIGGGPARFSPSRTFRKPLLRRLTERSKPLECGLLIPRNQASAIVGGGMGLAELSRKGHKPRKLRTELVPAWVIADRK